jgi:hypothetical protein
MSLVLVGGHDRMHREYQNVCEHFNCNSKIYTQMPANFNKMIGRPDHIILFTNTVSHKMVKVAVSEAKKKNIPITRCHSISATALHELLHQLV